MVQARDEVGQACCIGYVASPMRKGAGSGTWRQYRVQARDEVGGRAEHMVTHTACCIYVEFPMRGGGRDGVSVRDIKGGGADRGHGDSTVCCIGYVERPCGC